MYHSNFQLQFRITTIFQKFSHLLSSIRFFHELHGIKLKRLCWKISLRIEIIFNDQFSIISIFFHVEDSPSFFILPKNLRAREWKERRLSSPSTRHLAQRGDPNRFVRGHFASEIEGGHLDALSHERTMQPRPPFLPSPLFLLLAPLFPSTNFDAKSKIPDPSKTRSIIIAQSIVIAFANNNPLQFSLGQICCQHN